MNRGAGQAKFRILRLFRLWRLQVQHDRCNHHNSLLGGAGQNSTYFSQIIHFYRFCHMGTPLRVLPVNPKESKFCPISESSVDICPLFHADW